LHVLGLALLLVGYFGVWVPHPAVALVVTGRELSEFAKFFPQVQGSVVPIRRALFLTPLAASAVLLSLWVNRYVHERWIRVVGTGLALLLAAAALPALQVVLDPQYRNQLALAGGAALLVVLVVPVGRFSEWLGGILVLSVTAVGGPVALWQFSLLHPLVVTLYNRLVAPGWGLVLTVAGTGALLVSGLLTIIWGRAGQRVS
jgi:hypothetical protein